MLFYLSTEDKFLLEIFPEEVIFIQYDTVLKRPLVHDIRWIFKDLFQRAHMDSIVKYMTSADQADRNIGKTMLEQTLKIIINGEIVGWNEERFI